MRKRRRNDRGGGERQRLAGLVLALLPACMLIGPLLPNAVSVEPIETEPFGGKLSTAPLRISKAPLVAPIDPTPWTAPRLVDLDTLVLGSRARPGRYANPPLRPAIEEENEEQSIVLEEEVDEPIVDRLFDAAGEPFLTVDTRPLWDPRVFDVIPGLLDRNGYSEFDDFVGTRLFLTSDTPPAPAVPEPATGVLFAAGLLLLAVCGRRAP